MNKIKDYRLAKKLLRAKAFFLALTSATWIGTFKFAKDSTDKLNKYTTTYEIYSTLTGDTRLSSRKEKGNANEVIMKIYHYDEDNDGIRQVDYYYFEKNDILQLIDYLNLEENAIKCSTNIIQYNGSNEEYKEIEVVKNIDVDDDEFSTIVTSLVLSSLVPITIYGGTHYVEYSIIETQGYEYPLSLVSRVNLYNELREEEKSKTLVKKK